MTPSPWVRSWLPIPATCWKAAPRTWPGVTAWARPCSAAWRRWAASPTPISRPWGPVPAPSPPGRTPAAWPKTAASERTGCACMWPRTILLRSCTIPGRPAPARSWTWIPRRDGTRPRWSLPASFPTGNLRTAWPAACMTRSRTVAATSISPATTTSFTGSSSSGTGKGTTSFRLPAWP